MGRRAVGTVVRRKNPQANKLPPEDRCAHDWFRFVLSFPPHLVRDYLTGFGIKPKHRVLDPFCGTGTTVVECKKHSIPAFGIEASPFAQFAGQVKVDWSPDPDELVRNANEVAAAARRRLQADRINDVPSEAQSIAGLNGHAKKLRLLPPEKMELLLTDSISQLPLHKTLVLLDCLQTWGLEDFRRHHTLALAKALVFSISNLHFGPEVGVHPPKPDSAVIAPWLEEVQTIAADLRALRGIKPSSAIVYRGDSRGVSSFLERRSIDAVITSPPYPNEKDYTRTTRLESVLLGFLNSKADVRALKKSLVRSNTRSVYVEDTDDRWIKDHPEIQRIAKAIERRRIEMGKTSGFERMYHRVTKLYFGGMARHFADLRGVLKPGAQLAYVVGDQASYLRVMIRTGTLLGEIAERLGYKVMRIDLFRTRLATVTKEQLREEVLILRWPG